MFDFEPLMPPGAICYAAVSRNAVARVTIVCAKRAARAFLACVHIKGFAGYHGRMPRSPRQSLSADRISAAAEPAGTGLVVQCVLSPLFNQKSQPD